MRIYIHIYSVTSLIEEGYRNCQDCEIWSSLESGKVGYCKVWDGYTDATHGCDPKNESNHNPFY